MTMSTEASVSSALEQRLLPIADRYRGRKGITIPLLADLQKEMGYIAPEAVDFIAHELDIPAAEMFGVATFYAMFRLQPEGKHVIRLCRGTACHVQGSARIGEQIQRHLSVSDGGTTSADNLTHLCRHHHRLKSLNLARPSPAGQDDERTWTTITGRGYTPMRTRPPRKRAGPPPGENPTPEPSQFDGPPPF